MTSLIDATVRSWGRRNVKRATSSKTTVPDDEIRCGHLAMLNRFHEYFGNAIPKIVGRIAWPQSSHTTRLMHNGGRTYLMDSHEVNATGIDRFGYVYPLALSTASNNAGSCPWGWGRIIDITDETSPTLAGTFGLQVNDVPNCTTTVNDVASPSYQLVNYSSHYGGFDDARNAKLAFWTWYASGLRVFDISNPTDPTEIAYYNPPPISTVTNNEYILGSSPVTYDYTTSYTHYNPANGDIWFVSEQNCFQIVRLTKSAGPMTYPLDRRRKPAFRRL